LLLKGTIDIVVIQNMKKEPSLSIVIPTLNEEESLTELFNLIKKRVTHFQKITVIFVDDGSKDATWNVMKSIKTKNRSKKIKVVAIRMMQNHGKALALLAAFDQIETEFVATMDADLQDDPAELDKMYQKIEEGFDLVVGWKKKRYDQKSKLVASRIANGATKFFTGVNIHDMNCGLKLMRTEVAQSLHIYGDLHRFIPAIAASKGFKVGEKVVKHKARKYGVSKYGAERLLKSLFDFATILLITKFSKKPLHFFGPIGLINIIIGVLISLHLTILWFMGETIGTRPLLLLGILLIIFGIQTLSIGLLGDLIISQNNDKSYNIKEVK